MSRSLFSLLLLLSPLSATAQIPDEGRAGTFALTDCRIETVTDGTVENGTVVIRDGLIEAVGAGVAAPAGAEVVPCDGGTVYPGLIDSGTKVGLTEIGALDETRDYQEIGEVTPHMLTLTAVNASSVHIPTTRLNGVTTVLVTPASGLMPGTAALVSLHGYTPEQMDAGFRGVVANFPSAARRGFFDRRDQEAREKQAKEAREKLNETWEQALLFARIDSAAQADPDPTVVREYVPEMEALLPVVRGEVPLLIEANAAQDLLDVMGWVEEKGVRAILMGAAEGWRVADRLAESGLPVITGPVLALPTRDSDRYDRAYENAALLYAAGVPVALRTASLGAGGAHDARNLPFHAGFAAAYGQRHGFGPQQALEAVTIAPARMFGVADRMGSVEAGKHATLFVATGDPFETETQVTHLFIDGYRVPLVSRQTDLYDEFLDRDPGLTPTTR